VRACRLPSFNAHLFTGLWCRSNYRRIKRLFGESTGSASRVAFLANLVTSAIGPIGWTVAVNGCVFALLLVIDSEQSATAGGVARTACLWLRGGLR
jgi:hypothetical protein